MPPLSSSASQLTMAMTTPPSIESTFLFQQNSPDLLLKTHAYSIDAALESLDKPLDTTHRLNVKTHVFKKELQEYVPTQIEDRLRIETIIYVELSIVDKDGNNAHSFDYARMPKHLFYTQPDKVMTNQELASKRVIDIAASLHCPSNDWHEEKEACARCARRMSTKLNQDENRIIHFLPEIHRTEDGDVLVSFRNGVANIQFKINCYCGHKKEKEGFVIRFDPQSENTIASHVTLPLMFYHQNKNRIASRAAKAQQDSIESTQDTAASPRNVVKSVTAKSKREPKSKAAKSSSPLGKLPQPHSSSNNQALPSPPSSSHNSPLDSISPQLDDFMDSPDFLFTVPSPPPPDPFISLFPELSADAVSQQSQPQPQQPKPAVISHVTPNSGPSRGGTFVTVHGSDFPVGEMMYVCFGDAVVPVIPQRDHMLECYTPASAKTETVPVFAMAHNQTAPETSRMMSISARMDGPLDSVLNRANEFTLWSDLLDGNTTLPSSMPNFTNLEQMVLESFRLLDTPSDKNCEGLAIMNSTGHTMLHLSISLQYKELALDLLQRGIGLDHQDKNGLTALDLSQRLRLSTMTELLSSLTELPTSAPTPSAKGHQHELAAVGHFQDASSIGMFENALNNGPFDGQLSLQAKHDEGARRSQELQSPEVGRNHKPSFDMDGDATVIGDGGRGRLNNPLGKDNGDENAYGQDADSVFEWNNHIHTIDTNRTFMETLDMFDESTTADTIHLHRKQALTASLADANGTFDGSASVHQGAVVATYSYESTSALRQGDDEGANDSTRIIAATWDSTLVTHGTHPPQEQQLENDERTTNEILQESEEVVFADSDAASAVSARHNGHDVLIEAANATPINAGQAVVQSSQHRVTSEPLFLGGLPVTVSSHRRSASNSSNNSDSVEDA
ncbi:hypothetical protein BGZ94_003429 [Podila epigama]|nr:hypothetical protein BGZ94_003429 [Podila epigama]